MMTATLERPSTPVPTAQRPRRRPITGHFEETITGRYRPIPARQLALAWWLYAEKHITRRQLRVYFAAHEMAERRRYGRTKSARERPVYPLDEVRDLVGGRSSQSASRALSGDVKRLAAVGLVSIAAHGIRFVKSTDTLAVVEGGGAAFEAFLARLPNRSRTVPVPRRMLRALAAGFGRAETGYIIVALLRSVFWHRESGLYRVDGRTKLSEVADTFSISRRALSDARAHLIELGWLRPLEVPQWAANRYGVHDVVNVHWSPANEAQGSTEVHTNLPPGSVDNSAAAEGQCAGESASPPADFAGESASPCLNSSTSSTRNLNTRKLGRPAPDPASEGSRKKKSADEGPPTIRDVKPHDLSDTERLIELHRQAVAIGLAQSGGAGQLDFLSLANRARTRGQRPGALFVWLLKNEKAEFITIADEEAATKRLREHFNGPDVRDERSGPGGVERNLTDDECTVEVVLRVARQQGIRDPFRVAQQVKGWTRARWDDAQLSYQSAQARHWQAVEMAAQELA